MAHDFTVPFAHDLVPDAIRWAVLDARRVGSRVTCNPPPTDTDQDVIVMVHPSNFHEVQQRLFEHGWVSCKPEDYEDEVSDSFAAYRLGDINLIVQADGDQFNRFLVATVLAQRFNLLSKADRIALFVGVRRGQMAPDYGCGMALLEDEPF